MSKFEQGKVYLIIETSQVTTEIVNISTSRTKSEMPSKTVGSGTYNIVEVLEPVPAVLRPFTWLSLLEVNSYWEDLT